MCLREKDVVAGLLLLKLCWYDHSAGSVTDWRYASYTPLLIFMHDFLILTQNEAMGALPPSLAVAAPIASFWVNIVTYLMHKY